MEPQEGEPNVGGVVWFFGAFPVCFLMAWLLDGQHPAVSLGAGFLFAAFRVIIASPFLKATFGYPNMAKPLNGDRVALLIFLAGALDGAVSWVAVHYALVRMPVSALLYATLAVGLLLLPTLMWVLGRFLRRWPRLMRGESARCEQGRHS